MNRSCKCHPSGFRPATIRENCLLADPSPLSQGQKIIRAEGMLQATAHSSARVRFITWAVVVSLRATTPCFREPVLNRWGRGATGAQRLQPAGKFIHLGRGQVFYGVFDFGYAAHGCTLAWP